MTVDSGAEMCGSTENIETVARAICAMELTLNGKREETLAAEVDVYWHIVAAELEAPGSSTRRACT